MTIVPADFLGVVIDQGATELRRQFLLRAGLGPHLGRQRRHVALIAAHHSGREGINLTRTGCAGVGSTDSWQIVIRRRQQCIGVGINWRKRPISRRWIIPSRRVSLRGVVLRKALARQSCKANQQTRDDNCCAENHPLPPHASIGVQRGAFKDAAVQILDFAQRRLLPALSAAWESDSQSLTID